MEVWYLHTPPNSLEEEEEEKKMETNEQSSTPSLEGIGEKGKFYKSYQSCGTGHHPSLMDFPTLRCDKLQVRNVFLK